MRLIQNNINTINKLQCWPADLFVCCASFEKRCLTIPQATNSKNIKQALIVENVNIPQVKENNKNLITIFNHNFTGVPTRTDDPLLTTDNLLFQMRQHLPDGEGRKSIVIDITTFTHESLLILMNIAYTFFQQNHDITLLYNMACDYSIGDDIQDKWLSNGIKGVRSVLGYPGDVQPNRKTHLILFVGYESKRAVQFIDELEPNEISLGYGEPGTATCKIHEKASDYFHDVVKGMALKFSNVNSFPFSCSNPLNAKKTILEQANKFANHNIIIAPMNTKLSTVGTALAAIENKNIQLCYVPAIQYNFENYSSPSDQFYKISFDELIQK